MLAVGNILWNEIYFLRLLCDDTACERNCLLQRCSFLSLTWALILCNRTYLREQDEFCLTCPIRRQTRRLKGLDLHFACSSINLYVSYKLLEIVEPIIKHILVMVLFDCYFGMLILTNLPSTYMNFKKAV